MDDMYYEEEMIPEQARINRNPQVFPPIINPATENLNNRELPPDFTPVDKYQFTWTIKGVRCCPTFQV